MRRQRYTYTAASGAEVTWSPRWPGTVWDPGSRGIGGREFSAARVLSSFEIRNDALLRYRIRFTEAEWPAVRAMLERARHTTVDVQLDASDPTVRTCFLVSPSLGEDDDEGFWGERGDEPSVSEIAVEWMVAGAGWWDGAAFYTEPFVFLARGGGDFSDWLTTRASAATRITRADLIETVAANILRTNYRDYGDGLRARTKLEPAATNRVQNPRCEGAVAGVIGSGGSMPTHWEVDNLSGLTREVVGTVVRGGVTCLRIRIHGTPATSSTGFDIRPESNTESEGTYTGSAFLALAAGSMTNTSLALRHAPVQTPVPAAALATFQRHTNTGTQPSGGTRLLLRCTFTAGQPVDFTLDIGGPQFESGAFATSLMLPPVGAPAAFTRAVDIASRDLTGTAFERTDAEYTIFGQHRAQYAGRGGLTNPILMQIGTGTTGRLALFQSSATAIQILHHNGATTDTATVSGLTIAAGDLIQWAVRWAGDGTGTLWVWVNGVAATPANLAGIAPPVEWTKDAGRVWLYVNSRDGGNNAGAMDLEALVGVGRALVGSAGEVRAYMTELVDG